MNKFIVILTGGALLLGISEISFSDASRDAYHAYLTSQKFQNDRNKRFSERKIRVNSERKFARNYQAQETNSFAKRRGNRSEAFYQSKARVRVSIINKQAVEKVSTTRFRPSTGSIPGLGDHQNNIVRKPQLNINETYSAVRLKTYQDNEFSLQMPKELIPVEGKAHTFTFENSDFELSVKKFGEVTRRRNSVCGKNTFTFCAASLSKGENYKAVEGRGKLIPSTKIARLIINTDKILHDFNTIIPTYTETFAAIVPAEQEEFIFSRYFTKNIDGQIFLVQAKYPKSQGKLYVGLTKQLFESFRIYPKGYTK
jgi:hypothetical protein